MLAWCHVSACVVLYVVYLALAHRANIYLPLCSNSGKRAALSVNEFYQHYILLKGLSVCPNCLGS